MVQWCVSLFHVSKCVSKPQALGIVARHTRQTAVVQQHRDLTLVRASVRNADNLAVFSLILLSQMNVHIRVRSYHMRNHLEEVGWPKPLAAIPLREDVVIRAQLPPQEAVLFSSRLSMRKTSFEDVRSNRRSQKLSVTGF